MIWIIKTKKFMKKCKELSDYYIFQNMYVLDILKCDDIT